MRARTEGLLLVALTVVAVGVRLHDIGRESLWLDEAGRAAIATLPLGDILSAVAVVELSPPLYHLLLHLWGRLAGDGDISLRLFSALMALPAVPLAWALGRRVAGPAAGFVVAAQAALNPFAVHYGQETAMYALALPLGLATTLAAIGTLGGGAQGSGRRPHPQPLPEGEGAKRWLVAYVGFGTLALYTHYYAAFLLASIGLVGIVYSLRASPGSQNFVTPPPTLTLPRKGGGGRRLTPSPSTGEGGGGGEVAPSSPITWRRWVVAHALIALLFLPWLPTFTAQTSLAASVAEWRGVAPSDALAAWATSMLADGAPVPAGGAVAALAAGLALGAWRLAHPEVPLLPQRERLGEGTPPVVVWLLLAALVLPLALATVASGPLHSFRERGFLMLAGAPWVLLAAAIAGRGAIHRARAFARPDALGRPNSLELASRIAVGVLLVLPTVVGLASHFEERKEDWRAAAAVVESAAGETDPIFFVHFGAQLPFDRYFHGPQPRIGLPQSFRWEEGYRARYQVQAADVERRLTPTVVGERQAWAVLSHEQGRGGEHVLAALDRWGERAGDHKLYGVRIVRYQRRG